MSLTLLALSGSFFISTATPAKFFSLKSLSFTDRSIIPALYTCDGGGPLSGTELAGCHRPKLKVMS